METETVDTERGEIEEKADVEPIVIEQDDEIYILNLETKDDTIIFLIKDKEQSINYIRKMTFTEIKKLNNIFNVLKSFNEFYSYFKQLAKINKLSLNKSNDKITIIFYVEVLFNQEKIEIDLFQNKKPKMDNDSNIKKAFPEFYCIIDKLKEIEVVKNENNNLKIAINKMANEIDLLKNDNEKLNNDINSLKTENSEMKLKIEEQNQEIKTLKDIIEKNSSKSEIMNYDEKEMLCKEIENKMDQRIKEIKKLYQAKNDGGDPINFHSKCDNIPNTLVLIKSEGNKKFGGFTPIPWKSEGGYIQDSENKTFIFSLDKKKIYHLNDIEKNALFHDESCGPCFGNGFDIGIDGNPIMKNALFTLKSKSFDYNEDEISLSEYTPPYKLKAIDYEVFQIIFY